MFDLCLSEIHIYVKDIWFTVFASVYLSIELFDITILPLFT
jgi:hypothetical protein